MTEDSLARTRLGIYMDEVERDRRNAQGSPRSLDNALLYIRFSYIGFPYRYVSYLVSTRSLLSHPLVLYIPVFSATPTCFSSPAVIGTRRNSSRKQLLRDQMASPIPVFPSPFHHPPPPPPAPALLQYSIFMPESNLAPRKFYRPSGLSSIRAFFLNRKYICPFSSLFIALTPPTLTLIYFIKKRFVNVGSRIVRIKWGKFVRNISRDLELINTLPFSYWSFNDFENIFYSHVHRKSRNQKFLKESNMTLLFWNKKNK